MDGYRWEGRRGIKKYNPDACLYDPSPGYYTAKAWEAVREERYLASLTEKLRRVQAFEATKNS